MQHEVKIPALGETIVSGVITQWMVSEGDYVNTNSILYELETDKITSEGIAETSGTIKLLVKEGDEVAVGQAVAQIDDSAAPPTTTVDATANNEEKDSTRSHKHPPSVERLGVLSGVDPNTVSGSGKDGRVTKADMLAAELHPERPRPEATPIVTTPVVEKTQIDEAKRQTRKKLTPMRKRIAERLVSVKNEAAILTTFNEVDMSAVMKLRKDIQNDFVSNHGIKLGFMSFFVKAVVHALKKVPAINAQIEGNEMILNHYYDISVAVGTEKGLVTPVLKNCDQLSFEQIEQQLANYAEQAKNGKISIEDLQGGVFTLSNGGVYGSLLSTPIINPPQSGILGMHSIQQRPVAIDGQVVIRPMMYLALSYDHRIVDGKEAVTFLIQIKQAIENPGRLLFDI